MELKNLSFKETAIDSSSRTFEGYASTWDEDDVGDIIQRGAFKKSIEERLPQNDIKVLWQHFDPIGVPTEMREDDTGLFVKARVSRTQLGDEALELMRDGAVNRMSIGFTIPQGKQLWDEDDRRIITEVRLYEFSPVTFPANEMAVITGVKSLHQQIALAQQKGFKINESAELKKMFTDLKALLKGAEPGKPTPHPETEPLVSECGDILKNLIQTIRG